MRGFAGPVNFRNCATSPKIFHTDRAIIGNNFLPMRQSRPYIPRETQWGASDMDTHSRSFAKAVSWRITGTIDTMLLSWLITGSIHLAAAIGVTEVVTKSVLYYLHERAWVRVPYGRGERVAKVI